MRFSTGIFLVGLALSVGPIRAAAQNQLTLGTSIYAFDFIGTGSSSIKVVARTSNGGDWLLAAGSASGAGLLGSDGSYILSSSLQSPMNLQAAGGGSFSVTQSGTLNFAYTSNGAYGYPAGTTLLAGALNVSTVAMIPGSTNTATATGTLGVTGGTLAKVFSSGAGSATLTLALGSDLGSLVNQAGSITGNITYPSALLSTVNSGPALQITTNSLASGVLGQGYSVTVAATGGTSPYTSTLTSSVLPLGLTLDGTSRTIAGTPSQTGQFSLTVQVADSTSPTPLTVSKTYVLYIQGALDAYGGSLQLQCPAGVGAHFYSQKIGHRWWLCTPAGNVFWMRGVYVVDADGSIDYAGVSYSNSVTAKYFDADLRWGPEQNRRLKSWGFNALAEYASLYVQPTTTHPSWPGGQQPVLVPFTALAWPSYYALFNSGNYAAGPVKELVRATEATVYTGYRAHSPDVWDPNFKAWLDGFLLNNSIAQQWINGPNNAYFIGFNVDDTDFLQGFGAGSDFKTVANSVASGGREQPHLAWIILVTPPTQTQNTEFAVSYIDTTVYAKQALMNFLQQRYVTIAALNLAWGSTYSVFGSNTGWGIGTGLLDEDGTHSWVPRDYTSLSDATASVKKDLDDFLFVHAQKYFSDVRAVLNTRAPGRLYLGPTTLGSWGAPPRRQILQAAAGSLDIFMAATIPAGVPDDQQRIDFIAQYLGDKPWIEWEGFVANPDSYMSPFLAPDTVQAQSSTQAQRGQAYTNMVNLLLDSHTTAGAYPIVGFKWWQFVDNRGEQMNWGLVTRRDNEYDGAAARTASGTDPWGYPTGGEDKNYGDFLGAVKNANYYVLPTLVGP